MRHGPACSRNECFPFVFTRYLRSPAFQNHQRRTPLMLFFLLGQFTWKNFHSASKISSAFSKTWANHISCPTVFWAHDAWSDYEAPFPWLVHSPQVIGKIGALNQCSAHLEVWCPKQIRLIIIWLKNWTSLNRSPIFFLRFFSKDNFGSSQAANVHGSFSTGKGWLHCCCCPVGLGNGGAEPYKTFSASWVPDMMLWFCPILPAAENFLLRKHKCINIQKILLKYFDQKSI